MQKTVSLGMIAFEYPQHLYIAEYQSLEFGVPLVDKKPSCRQDSRPYCQKLQGSRDLGHAHFQGNSLCARQAFPTQSSIPNSKSLAQVVFEILRSKRIGVTSLIFQGHVTSSVTSPFDSPYAISYWQSFGTKPLSLTVSEIFNVKCNTTADVTLIQGQFILVPIDFSYTTSYRLSIVTFALGRTVQPQYITSQTTDRQTQHCSISATVSTVG